MSHVIYLTIIGCLLYGLWKRDQKFDPHKDRVRALVEKLETLRDKELRDIRNGTRADEKVLSAIREIESELVLLHQQDSEKQAVKYLS